MELNDVDYFWTYGEKCGDWKKLREHYINDWFILELFCQDYDNYYYSKIENKFDIFKYILLIEFKNSCITTQNSVTIFLNKTF